MQPPESVPLTTGVPRGCNSEIYLENNRLRERLGMPSRLHEDLETADALEQSLAGRHVTSRKRKIQWWRCVAIAAVILLTFCLGAVAVLAHIISSRPVESAQLLMPRSSRLESVPAGFVGQVGLEKQLPLGVLNWNDHAGDAIGIRSDYLLQNCQGPYLKRTFPDLDYALLGYNVLKGYPLAIGHDPGFTLPIFAADYSSGSMTADCRYSVPRGIVLIPDISCVTSFSSQIVQTSYELSQSLQTSAYVNGGGWGVSFSASAGYKELFSQMSTGQSVFIITRASCNYYYMKLLEDEAPPFHRVFLKWIIKLNNTDDETVYTDFFDRYGTHFLAEVRFGASFTYEHTMSAQSFKQFTERRVHVAVAASYSGEFSVGGGFNMDYTAKEAASNFLQQVTTRTITVGAAPPANGDAMTWASTVQESPVPVTYDLRSMEDLFSETFMGYGDTERLKVNFTHIKQTIAKHKKRYCQRLIEKGLLDSCAEMTPGLVMRKTELSGNYKKVIVSSMAKCIDECYKQTSCVAADFCTGCSKENSRYDTCHLYEEATLTEGSADDKYQSIVTLEKIEKQIVLKNTAVYGVTRFLTNATGVNTAEKCFDQCLQDAFCVVFTFSQSPDKQRCTLYSEASLRLDKKKGTSTHFISQHVQSVHDVYTTVSPVFAGR